jgi:hypothetical protein
MTRTTAPWRILACLVSAAALAVPLATTGPASAVRGSPAVRSAAISPPVSRGTLRIAGLPRDGSPVRAAGLSWRPARLPPGDRLLSFEVGYAW